MCHASCDAALGLQSTVAALNAVLLSAFYKLDTQQLTIRNNCCIMPIAVEEKLHKLFVGTHHAETGHPLVHQ